MLPSHFPSRPSSPTNESISGVEDLTTSTLDSTTITSTNSISKKRIPNNVIIPTKPLTLKSILNDPILLKQFTPNITLIVIGIIIFYFFLTSIFGESVGFERNYNGSKNWGDYVAHGLSRDAMLAQTPKNYALVGDKNVGGSRSPLYQSRTSLKPLIPILEPELEPDVIIKGVVIKKKPLVEEISLRNMEFENERHGIFGGSCVEWTSGIVGMGNWLGEIVDMRKESAIPDGERELQLEKRKALTDHIMKNAWTYTDAEDEANALKLLFEAKRDKSLTGLPLRDRVRDNEPLMIEAAKSWSRIYGVMEGENMKSALEVVVEKLVRRVPLVVFSKVSCPHSDRAKLLLSKYKLIPEAHIVELDMRPDSKNLKGLLIRRTLHTTVPNIIIGGRSIGGADDLERLEKSGELKLILEASGVIVKSH